jgi:peroxiredoxin
MLPLGTPAPDFSLPEVTSGATISLSDFAEKQALLVVFLCAHCPYVIHVQPELARLARDYADRSIAMIGITSNDAVQYPQDAPEPTAAMAREAGLTFPICYDESQAAPKPSPPPALLISSSSTPIVSSCIAASSTTAVRAAARSSRRGNLDGADLRAALDAVLTGKPLNPDQKPASAAM